MSEILQQIRVDFAFPVVFTDDVFAPGNRAFVDAIRRQEPERRHNVFFVIDEPVARAHPRLVAAIRAYCAAHGTALKLLGDPLLVPGGEEIKNDFAHVMNVVEQVNRHGIDRHSCLVVIGGGAVLDMAGFAAAIAHRSVRCVRLPTTVLSQDDSGVGVKSGVNLFGKKNFVGAFMPPFAVINDSRFLATLAPRDRAAGMAEAVKVALIRDRAFFERMEADVQRLAAGEPEPLQHLIRRSAELHMHHMRTGGDPFELGSARPLDYGHWSAHKLEALTHHRLRHGEAVAIGMAMDTLYAARKGHLPAAACERILNLLERLALPLWDDALLAKNAAGELEVLQGLREFREHLGGTLSITLLKDIGHGFEVHEMDEAAIVSCLHTLRERVAARITPPPRAATAAAG
jgi:3-dehydroquinate synthase